MATTAFLCIGMQHCLNPKRIISREEKGAFGKWMLGVRVSVYIHFFHLIFQYHLPYPYQLSRFSQTSTAWSAFRRLELTSVTALLHNKQIALTLQKPEMTGREINSCFFCGGELLSSRGIFHPLCPLGPSQLCTSVWREHSSKEGRAKSSTVLGMATFSFITGDHRLL